MRALLPGLALAGGVGAVAFIASKAVPLDAVLLALFVGLFVGHLLRHPAPLDAGLSSGVKRGLDAGIVLLGAQVNVAFLLDAGPDLLALVVIVVPLTFAAFLALGRLLGLKGDAPALLGAGTAICGLSAVAAAGATFRSRKEDVAVAVAAVGLLSAVGLVLYPFVGLLLAMPDAVYGAWSGLSLHAVANAVAAGFAVSPEAGKVATVAKLARVALLAPLVIGAGLLLRRARPEKKVPLLPAAVWGFLAVVVVANLVPLPTLFEDALRSALKAVLVLTMAALGLSTKVGHVRAAGARGLGLALVGWALLSAASLAGAWLLLA